jgi:hypothetical protein
MAKITAILNKIFVFFVVGIHITGVKLAYAVFDYDYKSGKFAKNDQQKEKRNFGRDFEMFIKENPGSKFLNEYYSL